MRPDSVVFIDDSPVERGGRPRGFPRKSAYSVASHLRFVEFFWIAPETQVPIISAEIGATDTNGSIPSREGEYACADV